MITARTVEVLIAIAVVQQALESWWGARDFGPGGALPSRALAHDLRGQPTMVRALWAPLQHPAGYARLQGLRLLGAGAVIAGFSSALPLLLLFHVMHNGRHRGTSNGGSDTMTAVVLLGLVVHHAALPLELALDPGLGWIAIQCVLSYVVAALARPVSWWRGEGLIRIVRSPMYAAPSCISRAAAVRGVAATASVATLLFEITTPLALVVPGAAAPLAALAGLFHVGLAVTLGLHRFLWPWAAAWGAILVLRG